MADYEADVVVVGSGAGGGMAAWYLAENGARVIVLERGDWFRPQDSSARHPDWEVRKNNLDVDGPLTDPSVARRRGAAIPPGRGRAQSADAEGRSVGFTFRNPFRYHRAFGVGGSTLIYEGEAHRFAPHAFRAADGSAIGVDWPLEYQTLEPWYAMAERLLHVSGNPHNLFKAQRGAYPMAAHPLTARRQWMEQGAARLGWHCLPNPLALPSRATPDHGPCMHSGHCYRGCPFGAKSSTDQLLRRTSRTGQLEILTGARVVELETSADRVTAVHFNRGGDAHVARGRQIVLAAGAIETPRLLLASQGARFPQGLGNSDDQVGRYLMETVFISRCFTADRNIESWKGPPQDARIWDFNRPETSRGINGFTLGASAGSDRFRGPAGFSRRVAGIGASHKAAMREQFGRSVWFIGVTDHQPHPDNRLTLSTVTDELGVPLAEIATDYDELEVSTLIEMKHRIDSLADACGAVAFLETISSYSQPSTSHIGGTCRMGHNREHSVTNAFGRVHDVRNLYLADGSVLPGQGMGDSPSLTIQALALRTADGILRNNP